MNNWQTHKTQRHIFVITKDRTYGHAPRTYFTAWLPSVPYLMVDPETLEPKEEFREDLAPAIWIDDAFSLPELEEKLDEKYGKSYDEELLYKSSLHKGVS